MYPASSIRSWRRPRLSLSDLKEKAARSIETHAATADAVADACTAIAHGKTPSLNQLTPVVSQFVDMVSLDYDLLPLIVSMQTSSDEYLFDHCVRNVSSSRLILHDLTGDVQLIS